MFPVIFKFPIHKKRVKELIPPMSIIEDRDNWNFKKLVHYLYLSDRHTHTIVDAVVAFTSAGMSVGLAN